jgi:hypothetical protein
MASKESMVVAPIVVALYDWAFEFDSVGEAWRRRTLYAGLAATWIVLVALAWATPRSTVGSTLTIGPWLYLLNQFDDRPVSHLSSGWARSCSTMAFPTADCTRRRRRRSS